MKARQLSWFRTKVQSQILALSCVLCCFPFNLLRFHWMRPSLPLFLFILVQISVEWMFKYHNPIIFRCHQNVLFYKNGLLSGPWDWELHRVVRGSLWNTGQRASTWVSWILQAAWALRLPGLGAGGEAATWEKGQEMEGTWFMEDRLCPGSRLCWDWSVKRMTRGQVLTMALL